MTAEWEKYDLEIDFRKAPHEWSSILLASLPWIVIIVVWLYILRRMQGGGTKGIFSFGKSKAKLLTENKPKVTFNVKEGLLKITCREGVDGNVIVYKTKNIPRQRWNTMVVNYKNGIMDIFINNELVASKSNLVPYMTHDEITSGSDNGINGGIKEVYYSNEPFSLSKIRMM